MSTATLHWPGSIFLDSDCDGSFHDPYSLLYGHHMENSKMFGDLDLYKDEAFFNENTTGTLVLPDRTYHLQIFACLLVPASEDAIFDVNQWDANLNGLLDFAQENALHLHSDTLDTVRARGGGTGAGHVHLFHGVYRCKNHSSGVDDNAGAVKEGMK